MAEVTLIEPSKLSPAPWRTTYTLAPDLAVLARSICTHGILTPLVVRADGLVVIDGHERLALATASQQVRESVGPTIPVTIINCTEQDAMILHVQMNRGRSSVVAKKLSALIRKLYVSGSMTEAELRNSLNMTKDEADLLLDGTIIKHRAIKEHLYSRAWVPIESSTKIEEPAIEGTPNDDR